MSTEERAIDPTILEKRKHPRFSVDMPIEYWRINAPLSRPGRAGDISQGGALLYLSDRILAGQNIGVRIYVSAGLESNIEALGQAAWHDSRLIRKDYFHRAGVKFIDISAENVDKLKIFLNAQKNVRPPSDSELDIPPGLFPVPERSGMDRMDGLSGFEEPIQEGKRELLEQLGDAPHFDSPEGEKKDEAKLPPELIDDLREEYSEIQRQNLTRKILDMSVAERFRLAVLANREARNLLVLDPNKMISLAVLQNPKVSENEVFQYIQRRDLSPDILLAIARDQKWIRKYPIKFAVVSHPKTPLSVAMNFLPHLHEKELKILSRDPNVSSVLKKKAEAILMNRNEK